MPWIYHLPPVLWSTLGFTFVYTSWCMCVFDIVERRFLLTSFLYSCFYTLPIFLPIVFHLEWCYPEITFFILSFFVLSYSIDVVSTLSYWNIFASTCQYYIQKGLFVKFWLSMFAQISFLGFFCVCVTVHLNMAAQRYWCQAQLTHHGRVTHICTLQFCG